MKANLLTVFAARNIINCFDSDNRTEFFVDDPSKGKSYIVKYVLHDDVKPLVFKVVNATSKLIDFLAIDGCLIGRAVQTERCDFIIFDDITLCLVEMKLNSELEDEGLSTADTRRKASRQITVTLDFLRQEFSRIGLTFNYPEIEGVIAVQDKFPKLNTSEKNFAENFLLSNKFPVFIASKKEFA